MKKTFIETKKKTLVKVERMIQADREKGRYTQRQRKGDTPSEWHRTAYQ